MSRPPSLPSLPVLLFYPGWIAIGRQRALLVSLSISPPVLMLGLGPEASSNFISKAGMRAVRMRQGKRSKEAYMGSKGKCMANVTSKTRRFHFKVLQGVLPIKTTQAPAEVIAGITLAALAIPEVMGYTKISG